MRATGITLRTVGGALGLGLLAIHVACGDADATKAANATGDGGAPSTSGTSGGSSTSGGTPNPPASTACEPDPLRTGIVAQQTGIGVDSFDCAIIEASAKYGEP